MSKAVCLGLGPSAPFPGGMPDGRTQSPQATASQREGEGEAGRCCPMSEYRRQILSAPTHCWSGRSGGWGAFGDRLWRQPALSLSLWVTVLCTPQLACIPPLPPCV